MSKGKIDIVFSVSNYGIDPRVSMRALLKAKNSSPRRGGALSANTLIIKPKHEIAKFETFQFIVAKFGLLKELDAQMSQPRGGVKITVPDLPAEFVHATREDGSEYDLILVNFGNEEEKHVRAFYLSDMQSDLIHSNDFNPQAEFTVAENPVEDEGENETEEDSE